MSAETTAETSSKIRSAMKGGVATRLVNGATHLDFAAVPGKAYEVQSSSNLTGWTYLLQAASGSNTLSVSGLPMTNNPAVFLRAVTPP